MTDRVIDLDRHRAEREAKLPAPPRVVFKGKSYFLPGEIPLTFVLDLGAIFNGELDRIEPLFHTLLGDAYDEIVPSMSQDDAKVFLREAAEQYGMGLSSGESDASPSHSPSTSQS